MQPKPATTSNPSLAGFLVASATLVGLALAVLVAAALSIAAVVLLLRGLWALVSWAF